MAKRASAADLIAQQQALAERYEGEFGNDPIQADVKVEASAIILPLDVISVYWNARKEFAEFPLETLANSMKERGLLQPIVVTKNHDAPGRYFLKTGERRFRAAKMLGWAEISCIVSTDLFSPKDHKIDNLIENIIREDLSPPEIEEGLASLRDQHSMSVGQISALLDKSPAYVSTILKAYDNRKKVSSDLKSKGVDPEKLDSDAVARVARLNDDERDAVVDDLASSFSSTPDAAGTSAGSKKKSAPMRSDVLAAISKSKKSGGSKNSSKTPTPVTTYTNPDFKSTPDSPSIADPAIDDPADDTATAFAFKHSLTIDTVAKHFSVASSILGNPNDGLEDTELAQELTQVIINYYTERGFKHHG